MELLISVVIGVLIMEAYAWLPFLSDWVLERAVQRLRKDDQDLHREDWRAALAVLPNTFVRLVHAVSFFPAAETINDDFYEGELSDLEFELKQFTDKGLELAELCGSARASLNQSKETLQKQLSEVLKKSDLEKVASANDTSVQNYNETVKSYRETIKSFACSISSAYRRAADLGLLNIEASSKRLDGVQHLLEKTSAKLNAVNAERLTGADPDRLDVLLIELKSEFDKIKSIFADDKWGDDEAVEQSARIIRVVQDVLKKYAAPI